jgi:adenosylcobalamin-dependent ribonucleoside-triphosphate reductase
LTFITKYSRRKEDGTKERWYEACRRVVEGYYSILKDHCQQNRTPWNDLKAQKAAQDAYDRLFTFKWTPPGRGLWMMGTEFVHGNSNSAALQNCFGGSEELITYEYGPISFSEIVGEVVDVWTKEGWKKADVSEFGVQVVQRVTFAPAMPNPKGDGFKRARSNLRQDIVVTPNHRWILADGSETTSLSVGDAVNGLAAKTAGDDYWDGFVHGLIFGDGVKITHRYINGDYGFELRACDDRTKDILTSTNNVVVDRFDKINYDRPSANGDPICSKRSAIDMKEFPEGMSVEYNSGFLNGWVTADASIEGDTKRLSSQHPQAEAWLVRWAASCGYVLTGLNQDSVIETNYGFRKNPCMRFTLRGDDDVYWKVEHIEDLSEPEVVYCATVPDTGSFTLASGIHTGNCAFISTEKLSAHSVNSAILPFIRLMEMSMLGVGVGFDTKGAGNLEIHEPSEAIQEIVIEDSREGWYESVGTLLESYFFKNRAFVDFDYNQIREAGKPILGFGGTAAGPSPLIDLHNAIRVMFAGRDGEHITSTDLVDLMNLIGKCVVAGNVRRSAEIAVGFADDEAFLDLKDFEKNPERMGPNGWGFTSNNSIFAEVGDDYSSIVQRIQDNGEPGFLWLDLCKSHGRMIDPPNYKDHRAAGTNPCGEQTLESYECCTLVETFPYHHEDLDDYKKTLKHAYLYAKAVTLMATHWPETNEVMQRNRRIGCSVSGVAQFVEDRGWTMLKNWLDEGYDAVQYRDHQYSEWLGVRESIKTTSVKPSGTVSLLAGATPGVHWPTASDTYIRRMRFAANDPFVPILESAGYHLEEDVMDPKHTLVAELPAQGPHVRTERDVTIWEKTELAVQAARFWADNQVSVTVTFQEHEKDQIPALLSAKDGQLKSLSLLPLLDGGVYAQMPYESISPEMQEEMRADLRPMSWDTLYDGAANDAEGERFCSNDVCELI